MADRPAASTPDEDRDVLFQSAYGDIPKVVLYGMIPFLFFVAVALFVHAVWFGGEIAIKGFKLSPEAVTHWICPAIWFLCALVLVMGVYRQLHPQSVVITENELLLPKGRFTSEVIRIRWNDLKATLWSGQISGIAIYEITCLNGLHGSKTMIASNLFRDFDEFATFALIVGEHMGEDWSIKGVLPGKIRGNYKLARRATGRIQAREDN
ncbi:MAG: hypothetical protein ACKV2Q_03230 [Planctomycetaceae bacterium]